MSSGFRMEVTLPTQGFDNPSDAGAVDFKEFCRKFDRMQWEESCRQAEQFQGPSPTLSLRSPNEDLLWVSAYDVKGELTYIVDFTPRGAGNGNNGETRDPDFVKKLFAEFFDSRSNIEERIVGLNDEQGRSKATTPESDAVTNLVVGLVSIVIAALLAYLILSGALRLIDHPEKQGTLLPFLYFTLLIAYFFGTIGIRLLMSFVRPVQSLFPFWFTQSCGYALMAGIVASVALYIYRTNEIGPGSIFAVVCTIPIAVFLHSRRPDH